MRDDYDDEDDGGRGIIGLLIAVIVSWAVVIVVTWALR
jgi:hypothetical protein